MATFHEFIQTMPLDDDAKINGYTFERVARYFFREFYKPSNYSIDNVHQFNEWDLKWVKKERGTDFICEVRSKDEVSIEKEDAAVVNIFACQAKFYSQSLILDPHYPNSIHDETPITEQNIKDFFGDAVVGNNESNVVEYFLICTTNLIDSSGKDYLKRIQSENNISINIIDRSALEKYSWPDNYKDMGTSDLTVPAIVKKTLRDYQNEAIEKFKDHYKNNKSNNRSILTMPCGTGKTFLGVKIHEALQSNRTLIVFPTIKLLKDTLWEWIDQRDDIFKAIAVVSDLDVANRTKDDKDDLVYDDILATTIGTIPTTSPEEIIKELKSNEKLVVFSTYHSTPRIQEAFKRNPELQPFDLIIADEAHHLATRAKEEKDFAFTTIMEDKKIPAHKRLFMTATPKVYSTKKEDSDELITYSMDDKKKFGPTVFSYSYKRAIEEKRIDKFKIIYIYIDDDYVFDLVDKNIELQDGKNSYAAHRAAIVGGIFDMVRNNNLRKMLTFHNSIDDARDFSSEMNKIFDGLHENKPIKTLSSLHVAGEMGTNKINKSLRNLKLANESTFVAISSARVLLEGVDVPTLDSIAFVNPKRITTDIVQAIGRAIRKPEGREQRTSLILVPIPVNKDIIESLDSEDDWQNYLKKTNSPYQRVITIKKALIEIDETYLHYLKEQRQKKSRKGDQPENEHETVVNKTNHSIHNLIAHTETKSLEHLTSNWQESFGKLQRYALTTSDEILEIPRMFSYEGAGLDSFASNQRRYYLSTDKNLQALINPEREALLESLVNKNGVKCWEWEPLKVMFEAGCLAIENFDSKYKKIDKKGILRIPARNVDKGINKEYGFVNSLRAEFRKHEIVKVPSPHSGTVTKLLVAAHETIKVGQNILSIKTLDGKNINVVLPQFSQDFEESASFKILFSTGDTIQADAPIIEIETKNTIMPEWKIERLQQIPGAFEFVSEPKPKKSVGEINYDLCVAFYKKNDHLRLPSDHVSREWKNSNKGNNSKFYKKTEVKISKSF